MKPSLNIRVAMLLCLVALCPAHAATKTWDGSSSGNWATGANWSGGTAPANGDDLVFPSGAARLVTTNNFSPNRNFASVTLLASGYVLRGNPIVASNLVASGQASGAATIDAALGMVFKPVITVSNAAATLRLRGTNFSLLGTVTVRGNGVTEISSPIAGSAGLVKSGTNVLLLHGNEANTYAGITTVNEGILRLSKTNVTAIQGNLTIGDGVGGVEADVVELLRANQIADAASVRVNKSGLLQRNSGAAESIGTLELAGGRLDGVGAAPLTLLSNVTSLASDTTALIEGAVDLAATRTFTVADGAVSPDLIVADDIDGGAGIGLIKDGPGTMQLSWQYNSSGPMIVRAGTLEWSGNVPEADVVVSNNAVLRMTGAGSFFGWNLTLNGNGDGNGALQFTNGVRKWSGTVTLASDASIGVSGPSSVLVIGEDDARVNGPGSLTKVGDGVLRFANWFNNNSYAGATYVNAGTLELTNAPGLTAIPGNLVVGDGAGSSNADVVRLFERNQIADSAAVTVNSSGWLDMSTMGIGDGETLASLVLNNGGRVHGPDSASLALAGSLTCTGNAYSLIEGGGYLHLAGSPGIVDVTGSGTGVNLDIQPVLSYGGTSIVKNGTGWLRLSASSGTPNFQVAGGRLSTTGSGSLGFAGGTVTVYPGATLQLGDGTYPAIALSLNGGGTPGAGGALRTGGELVTWPGSVFLNSASTFYVPAGGLFEPDPRLILTGVISGVGPLTKDGGGFMQFTGPSNNTYTSTTIIKDGMLDLMKTNSVTAIPGNVVIDASAPGSSPDLHLNAANQIANGFDVTMSGGMFDLNTFAEAIGTLNGGGAVTLGPGSVLTVSPGSGVICAFHGSFSSPGSMAKSGSGTLILSGTNAHTGTTTINAGTLQVDGEIRSSPLTLNGGRLQGSGKVANISPNNAGCLVTPGTSPGILTCSNFNASGTGSGVLLIEMAGAAPGTGYDQLDVRGTVNLNGITLVGALSFPSSLSNQFVIIKNDGADAVLGTFNGWPQNSVLTFNGEQFRLSYTGGDGNDVVLTQISGVFRPVLAIERIPPASVRLLWATNNAAGFGLQSNTNLNTTNWTAVSPPPSIVGANNVVTNTASGRRFYRLFKP